MPGGGGVRGGPQQAVQTRVGRLKRAEQGTDYSTAVASADTGRPVHRLCLPSRSFGGSAHVDQDALGPPLGQGFRAGEHGLVDQAEYQAGTVPHDREPKERGQVVVTQGPAPLMAVGEGLPVLGLPNAVQIAGPEFRRAAGQVAVKESSAVWNVR